MSEFLAPGSPNTDLWKKILGMGVVETLRAIAIIIHFCVSAAVVKKRLPCGLALMLPRYCFWPFTPPGGPDVSKGLWYSFSICLNPRIST